jgi:hypothetical protein
MTAREFRYLLDLLGWSYPQAAEELGVASGASRIGDWATGQRPVPPYIAASIKARFTLEELRGNTKDPRFLRPLPAGVEKDDVT